ncbi:hypothetical protein SNEBB_004504 [Seison nebaliae]|nr:hypothetical protein SNEBB_004504 [Seison nebaliae]
MDMKLSDSLCSTNSKNKKTKMITPDRLTPSVYMQQMRMSTNERSREWKTGHMPVAFELFDLNKMNQKVSSVNITEPMMQPTPSELIFQNYEPFEDVDLSITLRNTDNVSRKVRLMQRETSYFKIICPPNASDKVGPGLNITFTIRFSPDQAIDFHHEIVVVTEREKFIVPVRCISKRAILDLPDTITFNETPVKCQVEKILLVRNIGERIAHFTLNCEQPFNIEPSCGIIGINEIMQITVTFKPMDIGTIEKDLKVSFDTGEELFVQLQGSSRNYDIRLEKSSIRIEHTFSTLVNQRTISIINNSPFATHFTWCRFANLTEEQTYRDMKLREMENEGLAAEESALQAILAEMNTKDNGEEIDYVSLLEESIDTHRKIISREKILFGDEIFQITPLEGEIWPNSRAQCVVTFQPSRNEYFSQIAYCDVTGQSKRLQFKVGGYGIGAKAALNISNLDVGDVFIGSSHSYEIVFVNKGLIAANFHISRIDYDDKKASPRVGLISYSRQEHLEAFQFNPRTKLVLPDEFQTVHLDFAAISNRLGKFEEKFKFVLSDSDQSPILTVRGEIIAPTVQFDKDTISFHDSLSYGIPHQKLLQITNSSLVPIQYVIRMPIRFGDLYDMINELKNYPQTIKEIATILSDMKHFEEILIDDLEEEYESSPEFICKPSTGVIQPHSSQTVTITFTPWRLQNYENEHVVLDLVNVGKALYSIPFFGTAMVPKLVCNLNELNFSRCFINQNYTKNFEIYNDTSLTGRVFWQQYRGKFERDKQGQALIKLSLTDVFNDDGEEPDVTISARDDSYVTVVEPMKKLTLYLTLNARRSTTCRTHTVIPFQILGNRRAINIRCLFESEGAVVNISPNVLDFGSVKLLQVAKLNVKLSNESVVPAQYTARTVRHPTPYNMEPACGFIPAETEIDVDVTALFNEKVSVEDNIIVEIKDSLPRLLTVRGTGIGSVIYSEPTLGSIVQLDHVFTREYVQRSFTLTNNGKRNHLLVFQTQLDPTKKNTGKNQGKRAPVKKRQGTFIIKPDTLELAPGETKTIVLSALSSVPTSISEYHECIATIARTTTREKIFQFQVIAEFIDPTIDIQPSEIYFVAKKNEGTSTMELQTRKVRLKNTCQLPYTVQLYAELPFFLSEIEKTNHSRSIKSALAKEVEDEDHTENLTMTFLIDPSQTVEFNVHFRPRNNEETLTKKERSRIRITYVETSHLDEILVFGDILYPNLKFTQSNVDFGYVVNGVEALKKLRISNDSHLPVQYSWSFHSDTSQHDEIVKLKIEQPLACVDDNLLLAAKRNIDPGTSFNPFFLGGSSQCYCYCNVSCRCGNEIGFGENKMDVVNKEGIIRKITKQKFCSHNCPYHKYLESIVKEPTSKSSASDTREKNELDIQGANRPTASEKLFYINKSLKGLLEQTYGVSESISDTNIDTQPQLNEIFNICPMYGVLQPGEEQFLSVSFQAHNFLSASVTAVCTVVDGKTYPINLRGASSIVSYTIDRLDIDFGDVHFEDVTEQKLLVINTGMVPLDINILQRIEDDDSNKPKMYGKLTKKFSNVTVPGMNVCPVGTPIVKAANSIIPAKQFTEVSVRYFPGLPGKFHTYFRLQIAHYEPDEIHIYGNATFPHLVANLERDRTFMYQSPYHEHNLETAEDFNNDSYGIDIHENIPITITYQRLREEAIRSLYLEALRNRYETLMIRDVHRCLTCNRLRNPALAAEGNLTIHEQALDSKYAADHLTSFVGSIIERDDDTSNEADTEKGEETNIITEEFNNPIRQHDLALNELKIESQNLTLCRCREKTLQDVLSFDLSTPNVQVEEILRSTNNDFDEVHKKLTHLLENFNTVNNNLEFTEKPKKVPDRSVPTCHKLDNTHPTLEQKRMMRKQCETYLQLLERLTNTVPNDFMIHLEMDRLSVLYRASIENKFGRKRVITSSGSAGSMEAGSTTGSVLHVSAYRNTTAGKLVQYIIDFGYVIYGNVETRTVTLMNSGTTPLSFIVDNEKLQGTGFFVDVDRVKCLPPFAEGHQSVDCDIVFDAKSSSLQFGETSGSVPILIQNGPELGITMKAIVTMPNLRLSDDLLSFEEVVIGQAKVMSIQIANDQEIPCEWSSTIAPIFTKKQKLAKKFEPMHVKKKKKEISQKFHPNFELLPNEGVLAPKQKAIVQVKFVPNEDRIVEERLSIKIDQSSRRPVIVCHGRGLEPSLEYASNSLKFAPVLPHSIGEECVISIKNPCKFPIEIYNLEHDPRYLEEEMVLKSLPNYDQYRTLLLPPRNAGEGLPNELVSSYIQQRMEPEEEKEKEPNKTSETEKHSSLQSEQTFGEVRMTSTMVSLANYLDINITEEGEASRHRRGIAMIIHGPPNAGRNELSEELSKVYEAKLLKIDNIIKDAVAFGTSSAAERVRKLVIEAARTGKEKDVQTTVAHMPETLQPESNNVKKKKVQGTNPSAEDKKPEGGDEKKDMEKFLITSPKPQKINIPHINEKMVTCILPEQEFVQILSERFLQPDCEYGIVINGLDTYYSKNSVMTMLAVLRAFNNRRFIHFLTIDQTYENFLETKSAEAQMKETLRREKLLCEQLLREEMTEEEYDKLPRKKKMALELQRLDIKRKFRKKISRIRTERISRLRELEEQVVQTKLEEEERMRNKKKGKGEKSKILPVTNQNLMQQSSQQQGLIIGSQFQSNTKSVRDENSVTSAKGSVNGDGSPSPRKHIEGTNVIASFVAQDPFNLKMSEEFVQTKREYFTYFHYLPDIKCIANLWDRTQGILAQSAPEIKRAEESAMAIQKNTSNKKVTKPVVSASPKHEKKGDDTLDEHSNESLTKEIDRGLSMKMSRDIHLQLPGKEATMSKPYLHKIINDPKYIFEVVKIITNELDIDIDITIAHELIESLKLVTEKYNLAEPGALFDPKNKKAAAVLLSIKEKLKLFRLKNIKEKTFIDKIMDICMMRLLHTLNLSTTLTGVRVSLNAFHRLSKEVEVEVPDLYNESSNNANNKGATTLNSNAAKYPVIEMLNKVFPMSIMRNCEEHKNLAQYIESITARIPQFQRLLLNSSLFANEFCLEVENSPIISTLRELYQRRQMKRYGHSTINRKTAFVNSVCHLKTTLLGNTLRTKLPLDKLAKKGPSFKKEFGTEKINALLKMVTKSKIFADPSLLEHLYHTQKKNNDDDGKYNLELGDIKTTNFSPCSSNTSIEDCANRYSNLTASGEYEMKLERRYNKFPAEFDFGRIAPNELKDTFDRILAKAQTLNSRRDIHRLFSSYRKYLMAGYRLRSFELFHRLSTLINQLVDEENELDAVQSQTSKVTSSPNSTESSDKKFSFFIEDYVRKNPEITNLAKGVLNNILRTRLEKLEDQPEPIENVPHIATNYSSDFSAEGSVKSLVLAKLLPSVDEIRDGMGVGPNGPPIPKPAVFSICQCPTKRKTPAHLDKKHFIFVSHDLNDKNLNDYMTLLEPPKKPIEQPNMLETESKKNDAVEVASVLDYKQIKHGKNHGSHSKVRITSQEKPVQPTASEHEVPNISTNQDGHLRQFRWLIQPKGEIKIPIYFQSDTIGKYDQIFNFEMIAGCTSASYDPLYNSSNNRKVYQVACHAVCSFPNICREPRVIFPGRTVSKITEWEKHRKVFCLSDETFHFGPVWVGASREFQPAGSPYETKFHIVNNGPFSAELSFYLLEDTNNDTFILNPTSMLLEVGKKNFLTVNAYPRAVQHFNDCIVCCIKENPEPMIFKITVQGVKPDISLDRNVFNFDQVVIRRKETRKIVLKNPINLPIAWKLVGVEQLGEEFSVTTDNGVIQPRQEYDLVLYFHALKPLLFTAKDKKQLKLEVSDVDGHIGTIAFELITVTVEAYDVKVDIQFPKGNEGVLNFGVIRVQPNFVSKLNELQTVVPSTQQPEAVVHENRLSVLLRNRGKKEISYEFNIDPKFTDVVEVFPAKGTLIGAGDRNNQAVTSTPIHIAVMPIREFNIKEATLIKCKIIEPNAGTEGMLIAVLPLKMSAKTVTIKYSFTPSNELDFGSTIVGSRTRRKFTIANRGEVDMKFTISWHRTAGVGGTTEVSQQQEPKPAPPPPVSHTKEKKDKNANKVEPKTLTDSAQMMKDVQKLTVGAYTLYPSTAVVGVDQSQIVTVELYSEISNVVMEYLRIDFVDKNAHQPTSESAHVLYPLKADNIKPGLDLEVGSTEKIFEEHRIVNSLTKTVADLRALQLKVVSDETLANNEDLKRIQLENEFANNEGIYGREENRFYFGQVIVGLTRTARFKLANVKKIICDVRFDVTTMNVKGQGADVARPIVIDTDNDAFSPQNIFQFKETSTRVEPHSTYYVTVSFIPLAIQSYVCTLNIYLDQSPQPLHSFELMGDGILPRIQIIQPSLRDEQRRLLLPFRRMNVTEKQNRKLIIRNDSHLPTEIDITMNDANNVFWLRGNSSIDTLSQTYKYEFGTYLAELILEVFFISDIPGEFEGELTIQIQHNQYEDHVIYITGTCYEDDVTIIQAESDFSTFKVNREDLIENRQALAETEKNEIHAIEQGLPSTLSTTSLHKPVPIQALIPNVVQQNQLNLGSAFVDQEKLKMILIQNFNSVYPIRFDWSERIETDNYELFFSPQVGHVLPNTSKEIILTFKAKKVCFIEDELVKCQIQHIRYNAPALVTNNWDDRLKVVKWKDVEMDKVDDNVSEKSRIRVVEIQTPPAYEVIGKEHVEDGSKNIVEELELLISVVADLGSVIVVNQSYDSEIFQDSNVNSDMQSVNNQRKKFLNFFHFKDTLLFQERYVEIVLYNRSLVDIHFQWKCFMEDPSIIRFADSFIQLRQADMTGADSEDKTSEERESLLRLSIKSQPKKNKKQKKFDSPDQAKPNRLQPDQNDKNKEVEEFNLDLMTKKLLDSIETCHQEYLKNTKDTEKHMDLKSEFDVSTSGPLPFYVKPMNGVIKSQTEHKFQLYFRPLLVNTSQGKLVCQFSNMKKLELNRNLVRLANTYINSFPELNRLQDMNTQLLLGLPLVIPVKGQSHLPFCHIDIPHSTYLTLGRRNVELPGPNGAPPGTVVDPDTRVIEMKSIGLNNKIQFKFNVWNPTNVKYNVEWQCLDDISKRDIFDCVTPNCWIETGRIGEVCFTFTPRQFGLTESFWVMKIPKFNMTIPFIVVGVCSEPHVYFSVAKVQFKPVLLGRGAVHEEIKLVNMESRDIRFNLVEKSLMNEKGFVKDLKVTPTSGIVPRNSSLPFQLQFIPTYVGESNYNVRVKLDCARQPISLNIKGSGYVNEVHVEVMNANGIRTEIDSNNKTVICFGKIEPNQSVIRQLYITNPSSFTINFTWKNLQNIHMGLPETMKTTDFRILQQYSNGLQELAKKAELTSPNTISNDDQLFPIGPSETLTTELFFEPHNKTSHKAEGSFCLNLVDGQKYYFETKATVAVAGIILSTNQVNFKDVLVFGAGMKPKEAVIFIKNNDKRDHNVVCNFQPNNHLSHDFVNQLVRKQSTITTKLRFTPRIAKKYEDTIEFQINGLQTLQLLVKGRGIAFKVDVLKHNSPKDAKPIRTLNMGICKIGTVLTQTVDLCNRTPLLLTCDLSLGSNAPLVNVNSHHPRLRKSHPITCTPSKNIILHPKARVPVSVTFSPRNRMATFTEEMWIECEGWKEPSFLVKATCHGPEFTFDTNNIVFGAVVLRCQSTHMLTLVNSGDIGAAFNWDLQRCRPDFNIIPASGYSVAGTNTIFEVTFSPKKKSDDYYVDNVLLHFDQGIPSLSINITGTCAIVQPQREILTFQACVRETISRLVTIQNKTAQNWNLNPVIESDNFNGSNSFSVPAYDKANYTLYYHPVQMTAENSPHTGTLFFPLANGSAILYNLVGIANPPPVEKRIQQDIPAKTTYTQMLHLENWLKRSQKFHVFLKVETVAANGTIIKYQGTPQEINEIALQNDSTVNLTGVDYMELSPSGSADYMLTFFNHKEGITKIEVKFTNNLTSEYIWFDLTYRSTKPNFIDSIALTTAVRQRRDYKIDIPNPLNNSVTFNVSATHADIIVPNTITVPGRGTAQCAFEYLPLKVGETRASLELISSELGLFSYQLNLTATKPKSEQVIHFSTALGASQKQVVKFKNFARQKTEYSCIIESNQWRCDSQVPAAPAPAGTFGTTISLDVVYEPTYVTSSSKGDNVHQSTLIIQSASGGQYKFPLVGQCVHPTPQGPFIIPSGQSIPITFRNIYPEVVIFSFTVDHPSFHISKKVEKLKPKQSYRCIVTFDDMKKKMKTDVMAKMIIAPTNLTESSQGKERNTEWIYYLHGKAANK